MDIGNIILFGIPAAVLIPLIVQAAKALGLPDNLAPWLTLGLSGAAAGLAQLMDVFPAVTPFVSVLVGAIVLYLTVTGLYHTTKNTVSTLTKGGDST